MSFFWKWDLFFFQKNAKNRLWCKCSESRKNDSKLAAHFFGRCGRPQIKMSINYRTFRTKKCRKMPKNSNVKYAHLYAANKAITTHIFPHGNIKIEHFWTKKCQKMPIHCNAMYAVGNILSATVCGIIVRDVGNRFIPNRSRVMPRYNT